jgi:ParB-like nuclease domain
MNFLPGELSGGTLKLPIGEFALPDSLRGHPGGGSRDDRKTVIVGLRPEHFEDASLVADKLHGHSFRAKVDVLESMGSEYYAYFEIASERVSASDSRSSPPTPERGPVSVRRRQPTGRPARRRQPRASGRGARALLRDRAPADVRSRLRPESSVAIDVSWGAMPQSRSTGMPAVDAQHDFLRARRRATTSRLIARLRREPDDVGVILPFEEVIGALGLQSERRLGLRVVALDAIVGTIDRERDFDRQFRPTSRRVRARWEQIAAAMRRGEALPPVDLLKVGQVYFVSDGHHRVSVASALGLTDIDAYVTEIVTRVDPDQKITLHDLPLKSHERVFFERVPLPAEARGEIVITDPWDYGKLAEGVEAWGFRAMREHDELFDRAQTAQLWLEHEYRPVVAMLREAELIGERTETEAYMRITAERYRLLRTHEWNEEVLEQVVKGGGRKRRSRT